MPLVRGYLANGNPASQGVPPLYQQKKTLHNHDLIKVGFENKKKTYEQRSCQYLTSFYKVFLIN